MKRGGGGFGTGRRGWLWQSERQMMKGHLVCRCKGRYHLLVMINIYNYLYNLFHMIKNLCLGGYRSIYGAIVIVPCNQCSKKRLRSLYHIRQSSILIMASGYN